MAGNKNSGRISKYEERIARQAGMLCAKHGYTDKQLADFFQVTEQTINNWKKKFPIFFESLKAGKKIADDLVELSLLDRAMGVTLPKTKVFCQDGQLIVHEYEEELPPDVGACKVWLYNRRPGEWSDKQEQGEGTEVADAIREVANKLPR